MQLRALLLLAFVAGVACQNDHLVNVMEPKPRDPGATAFYHFYTEGPDLRPELGVASFVQFGFNMNKKEPGRPLINPAFHHVGTRLDSTEEWSQPKFERCIRTLVNEPTGWEWEVHGTFTDPYAWKKGCIHFGCARCFFEWIQEGDTLKYVDLYKLSMWWSVGGSYWIPKYDTYTVPRKGDTLLHAAVATTTPRSTTTD
jgi:hypothetical protein